MARAMSGQAPSHAPSAAMIERLARDALARIPEPFSEYLGDIVLVIEEFADDATLDALGIDDPYDLTGLYHGRPVGEKSSWDVPSEPDRIHLYRRPLLEEWVHTGVSFEALINNVVVHEVGHHFGLSDEQIHALEDAAE
jgi:predicted Zn-dependent protease with MMP-like domain